ncbi:MAG: helix-turn-helix transcriptional regulator [Tepidisphaeraceae bacterium]|jgi:transcriptional regulator with XRE-family HTH domain
MPQKPLPMSDQIRRAIDASGMSRYRICKEIGIPQSTMSRFMSGKLGLSMEVLDRLGALLGLEIVAGQQKVKGKVNRGEHRK